MENGAHRDSNAKDIVSTTLLNVLSSHSGNYIFTVSKLVVTFLSFWYTSFDCGYFMLKFIELWTGRQMLPFNPEDMPAIRKLFLLEVAQLGGK